MLGILGWDEKLPTLGVRSCFELADGNRNGNLDLLFEQMEQDVMTEAYDQPFGR